MARSSLVAISLALTTLVVFGSASDAGRIDAYGPFYNAGTPRVGSTTYYSCRSGTHSALDMSRAGCGSAYVYAMLYGSRYYRYAGGCGYDCNGSPTTCNGGAGNYYTVRGSNGYDFRELHLNPWSSARTKYYSRGQRIGTLGSTGHSYGAHVHSDNRRYGTRLTYWYTSVGTTCGTSAASSRRIGRPAMS